MIKKKIKHKKKQNKQAKRYHNRPHKTIKSQFSKWRIRINANSTIDVFVLYEAMLGSWKIVTCMYKVFLLYHKRSLSYEMLHRWRGGLLWYIYPRHENRLVHHDKCIISNSTSASLIPSLWSFYTEVLVPIFLSFLFMYSFVYYMLFDMCVKLTLFLDHIILLLFESWFPRFPLEGTQTWQACSPIIHARALVDVYSKDKDKNRVWKREFIWLTCFFIYSNID